MLVSDSGIVVLLKSSRQCSLYYLLTYLQAQPIETIQDAAHRAAEKTAAAVVELQTTAEKQGECLVQ